MSHLSEAILTIRDLLKKGAFANEAQVSKGVVMRLLQQLGWDVFDPDRVSSEFTIGNRKVDYALRHEPFGAVVLIEVKAVGKADAKGEDQLFKYCFDEGVPLAVLTDGRTWNFYRPAGKGNYEQRRFAVVDLVDGESGRCAGVLSRYLAFETVASGQSEKNVQADYDHGHQQILAKGEFPTVFRSLIEEVDPRVVAVFGDEVERRCGIRPEESDVSHFLRSQFARTTAVGPTPVRPPGPPGADLVRLRPDGFLPGPHQASPSFRLFGKQRTFRNNDELIAALFAELANRDPDFCEKCAPRIRGSQTPILSRRREDFHRRRSYDRARELPGGWWMNVVGDARAHDHRIRKACEVAGINHGSDLVVHLRGKAPSEP